MRYMEDKFKKLFGGIGALVILVALTACGSAMIKAAGFLRPRRTKGTAF